MNEDGLQRRSVNHTPLSPLSFLKRTAAVFPDHPAVADGEMRLTWAETDDAVRRLAAGLAAEGVRDGDVVAILAPNMADFYLAGFAVPLLSAVLLTLNTRLDPATLAYCLEHSDASVVLVDETLAERLAAALRASRARPKVIALGKAAPGVADRHRSELMAHDAIPFSLPDDEWASFSLSYTSGTTGRPKGVVYSHRGVATTAISNALDWAMGPHPVYLWTLPMFHCAGWCFPYTIALTAGLNVCLRSISAQTIGAALDAHPISHFCGAPIVMQMAIEAAAARGTGGEPIKMMTAAAPPPAAVLQRAEEVGIDVTHVYGLTEVYGPCVVSAWNPKWNAHDANTRARLKARQGVPYSLQEHLSVRDPETLNEVPRDGETIGEIMIAGNIVMKGYLKDRAATDRAFAGDVFHTGDLAVWHPDGYVEIKDRAKDIIISGGENISSIEVEDALYSHPAVGAAAVVAMPDERWGERPCAFVELTPGAEVDEASLIAHCRTMIASFKLPARIAFEPLPKTSTGKVQKFALRERARELAAPTESG